jgi:hypothetical protein
MMRRQKHGGMIYEWQGWLFAITATRRMAEAVDAAWARIYAAGA